MAVTLSINEAYTETDLQETLHGIRRTACWFVDRARV